MKMVMVLLCGICLGILVSQVGLLNTQNAVAQTEVQERYDPTGKEIYWESVKLEKGMFSVRRTWVPGGWFVSYTIGTSGSMEFYPDPEHTWQPAVKDGAPWGK